MWRANATQGRRQGTPGCTGSEDRDDVVGDVVAVVIVLAFFALAIVIVRACDAVTKDSIDLEPEPVDGREPVAIP